MGQASFGIYREPIVDKATDWRLGPVVPVSRKDKPEVFFWQNMEFGRSCGCDANRMLFWCFHKGTKRCSKANAI